VTLRAHLAVVAAAILFGTTFFVVKDAEVVETGTHHSLIAAGGVYANLYDIQTSGAT